MKGKAYIIATRDFTYINFSIFPEMAIYSQRKYVSPKTTTTISERTASDCRRPQHLLSWSAAVSSYHSIVEVQYVVSLKTTTTTTTTNPNRKSLCVVFNSEKGYIQIQNLR